MQNLFNIIYVFSVLLASSLSFWILYVPSRTFHYAHAFAFTLGAYSVYFCHNQINLNFPLGLLLGIIPPILFGTANGIFLYRPLKHSKNAGLKMLILSIGVYIFSMNLLAIFFKNETKILYKGQITVGNNFFGAYLSDVQIVTIVISFSVFILTSFLWYKTKFGRAVRAIASNPELSQINGIPKDKIIAIAFALGSGIAGIVGILVGFDVGITPAMGFSVLLYGVAAMIIGGIESLKGVIAGALILAVTQNMVAYHFDSKWTDTVTYLLLIIFLIVRPYGISGTKNKKVEI